MITPSEYKEIAAAISDISTSKDFIKDEIYRKFTNEEVRLSFSHFSKEALTELMNRLIAIDEFELCDKIKDLISSY